METPPADRSIILMRSGREVAHRGYGASTVQKDIAGKWSPGADERTKEFGYVRNPLCGVAKGPRPARGCFDGVLFKDAVLA